MLLLEAIVIKEISTSGVGHLPVTCWPKRPQHFYKQILAISVAPGCSGELDGKTGFLKTTHSSHRA